VAAQELVRLRRYRLITVDEVGYIPFEQDAANVFFQLVSSRYEHASLILTSNLSKSSPSKAPATDSKSHRQTGASTRPENQAE
jgi:DNA replication protein DnaC